ncbi:hypothetical protein [Streptomyces sp. NPDC048442]|uniref:hypothetical protein n=1 Tax=Streptomyces sp. NPDC048442 TaxID=3154823 RepID=UPI00341F64DA
MSWQPLLTVHELAALRLLARGLHHLEIARELGVRPETGGRLLHGAQIHLGARTLAHAVARGYEAGIIQPAGGTTDQARSMVATDLSQGTCDMCGAPNS